MVACMHLPFHSNKVVSWDHNMAMVNFLLQLLLLHFKCQQVLQREVMLLSVLTYLVCWRLISLLCSLPHLEQQVSSYHSCEWLCIAKWQFASYPALPLPTLLHFRSKGIEKLSMHTYTRFHYTVTGNHVSCSKFHGSVWGTASCSWMLIQRVVASYHREEFWY